MHCGRQVAGSTRVHIDYPLHLAPKCHLGMDALLRGTHLLGLSSKRNEVLPSSISKPKVELSLYSYGVTLTPTYIRIVVIHLSDLIALCMCALSNLG